ncbi:MAG: bepC [Hyphomicrobiales bacterium]|nr:bepC [Hyphomicrobiales bacterium]
MIRRDAFIPAPGPKGRRGLFSLAASLAALVAGCVALAQPLSAETISGALARAYGFNPDLNAQRASGRATDENLPTALSGYRPTITANGDVGFNVNETSGGGNSATRYSQPRGVGLSVTQNLWNGNRTANGVSRAESQILQARENTRLTEQNILSNAATSYMNVLRDTAILNLRRNNVEVLEQQLRQTRDRFQVGEVTRTDVAQAEASLAQGQADAFTAQANLQTSIANFRQVIGIEPSNLQPARPLDKVVPASLKSAIALSELEHPAIQAARHNVDAASLNVKVITGQLYPTVGVTGSLSRRYDTSSGSGGSGGAGGRIDTLGASVVTSLSVPIYEGGAVYSAVRQAKELLGQAQLQADLQREQIRALVVSNWGTWVNSSAVIQAAQAQVRAAEIALNGVREEAKVGQRTTLDVLNAQQLLLNARVQLVSAQRDRVVSSYALLASVGRLSATTLGLQVVKYDPTIHFDQVKGKWIGTSTPDGR